MTNLRPNPPEMDLRELLAAADRARAAADYATAIRLYTCALESDIQLLTSNVHFDLLSRRAECCARVGDWPAHSADLAGMAGLCRGSEQRIAERTAQLQAANTALEQREAELEIINQVGRGLAKELDFQAIIDWVGNKLREIFNARDVSIRLYDTQTNLVHWLYIIDGGQRAYGEPTPLGGFAAHVIRTRQPLLVNQDIEKRMAELGSYVMPGSAANRSFLGVPILAGDQVTGVITLEDPCENAYPESAVNLLTTLASNLGVALQNARLFDETKRLLAETQQRTAELQIINSVQQGLAAQLDMQAIYDLVGDKIRDLFDAQVVGIVTFDHATGMVEYRYVIEKGQRFYPEPNPFGSIAKHLIRSRQPLLINQDLAQRALELGITIVPGTAMSKSMLNVPLIVGNQVMGGISLENIDRENVFSETDVRLLTTLASSMSVALENARLFAETKRLLAETEQRARDLATINEAGQALASKLETQAIYDLVGDKLRDIFDAQVVSLITCDRAANLAHYRYVIENGERRYVDPIPPGGFTAHILRTGQPLLFNQVTDELRAQYSSTVITGNPARSYLGVPLIRGKETFGVITLQNVDRENAFSESDVRLLTTLSSSMSVALENARLFDETRRLLDETQQRNAELAIVNRVGEGLARQLEFDAILELVGSEMRSIFPPPDILPEVQGVFIALYDQQTEMLRWPFWLAGDGHRVQTPPEKIGRGLTTEVIRSRQPLLIGTIEELYAHSVVPVEDGEPDSPSWLGVPILVGDKAIGVLAVMDPRPNFYTSNDVRLLSTLAANLGTALENARLFSEERQRATELATIDRISQAISSQLEVNALIQLAGEQIRDTFRADIAYIALLDRAAGVIRFPYAFGETFGTLKYGEGLTSKIIDCGQPLLINEDVSKRTVEMGATLVGLQSKSYLGVPILAGKQVLGLVSVQSTHEEGYFDEGDKRLLMTIAANMGTALQNAQLYEETKRHASETAALTEIGREISSTLDLHTVLERITTNARELLAAYTSAVYLLEPDGQTLHPIAAVGDVAGQVLAASSRLGEGIIGHIAQSGVAEAINDVTQDPRTIHIEGTAETESGEKMMVAPLWSRDQLNGAMAVWRSNKENAFTQDELDFFIGLSRQAAIAIQNARLFEQAQEAQRRLADIVDFLPDAVLVINRAGEVIAWNRAIEELTGVKAEAMLGRGNFEYALPFYGERRPILIDLVSTPEQELEQKYAQIKREGNVLIGETYVPHLKGGGVYLLGTASALHDSKGNIVGAIEVIRDFTERVRAEEALKKSERLYRSVIDNSIDVFYRVDLDNNVVLASPSGAKLLGYDSVESLIGLNIVRDVYANPEDRLRLAEAIQKDGMVKDFETTLKRRDGSQIVVLVNSRIYTDENGNRLGLEGFLRDFTERKRMEEALRQAKEAADSANQAKSAFLATMSHEIRTPMNAIIGMSGLLMDTPLSKEQREYADIIRNSGDALLTIINDILDFSKIEAGKMELECQPFELRGCIESALDLVASRASDKGLDLAYLIDDDVPPAIVGDVTRLRQICINLLTNAVKFTERGEVVLTVTTEDKRRKTKDESPSVLGPPSSILHFSVRDTGIGIPSEQMDRLFRSFSQVDVSTSRRYGGTGLGLAISKRLSEMMGGTMWVESEGTGKGSTFHFSLAATLAPDFQTRPGVVGEQPPLAGKRLLIVDDNATNRLILIRQTRNWGMLTRATESPREALAWIARGDPFDLAILDLHMQEMDGLALTAEIRKLRDAQALPIFIASSLGKRETTAEALGIAAFLSKPLKQSQLYDAVAGLFATAAVGPTTAPAKPQARALHSGFVDPEMAKRLPLRILLAEDNAVNQKLALRLLGQMGYRADVAGNGLEAIQAIERQAYDVVLMDVQMPELDGLEATRQICQRWPRAIRPRIIAMTANAMQGDRDMCLAAGMDDYLSKPIRVNELVQALSKCTWVPSDSPRTRSRSS
jgi:PAS domain S-box-containing protein